MIEVKVGGMIYGGWKSARVQFGIEQIAGSFELGVTDRWSEEAAPRTIRRGDKCQVLIDGEIVVTGYVDEANPEYDADNRAITVTGRDVTGDLVDCSAIHKSGQWSGATLDKIVRDLCKPFGIPVLTETNVGKAFPTYSIQEGETVHECIDRACRMRAVMPVSDGKGNLVLTRAASGNPVAQLIEGENILSARGEFDMKERYSRYIVKGQDRSSDDDWDAPELHAQPSAVATDDFVKRYRPLIVLAEDRGENATFKQRAEWERNVRRGRSARATIRVPGWRNPAGRLWRANSMVYLKSPWLAVDANLLVVGGTFILDENSGQITELNLAGREAFDLVVGVDASPLERAIKGGRGAGRSTRVKKKSGTDWSDF